MDGNTTVNIIKKLGWQVYLTNPYEHMYERLEDMPKANYLNQVRDITRLNNITNCDISIVILIALTQDLDLEKVIPGYQRIYYFHVYIKTVFHYTRDHILVFF
mgnify:CR=1 FL=1